MSSLNHVSRLKLLTALSLSLLGVACASMPPESPAQLEADRALAANVRDALNRDPEFFFRHVDVEAENGKVSLSGYVWSGPAIARADRLASQVPGVTSVSEQLELERNGSDGAGSAGSR